MKELWDKLVAWATSESVISTAFRIVISLLILLISFRIITVVTRKITKKMLNAKKKPDKTLVTTLMYVLALVLKVLVAVCLIGYLGIDTSGLTALIASLGVCFGLAVNGAVSNRTPDNKLVYVPNGNLSSDTIINYSMLDTRRVDLVFSIGYQNDFEKAKEIIAGICDTHPLILKTPEPLIRVSEHGASSVNIVTKVWVNRADYWTVNFDLLESVKIAFDRNGIEIPFNQLDVHVKKDV